MTTLNGRVSKGSNPELLYGLAMYLTMGEQESKTCCILVWIPHSERGSMGVYITCDEGSALFGVSRTGFLVSLTLLGDILLDRRLD